MLFCFLSRLQQTPSSKKKTSSSLVYLFLLNTEEEPAAAHRRRNWWPTNRQLCLVERRHNVTDVKSRFFHYPQLFPSPFRKSKREIIVQIKTKKYANSFFPLFNLFCSLEIMNHESNFVDEKTGIKLTEHLHDCILHCWRSANLSLIGL